MRERHVDRGLAYSYDADERKPETTTASVSIKPRRKKISVIHDGRKIRSGGYTRLCSQLRPAGVGIHFPESTCGLGGLKLCLAAGGAIIFALSAKRRRCALAVSVHITQSCHVAKVARPKYTTVRLINSFRATAFDDSENLRKLSRKIRIYLGHVPVAIIRMDTSLSTPVNVI